MLKAISTITNALGALNYKGTWNASSNTPTLADGTGAKGDYYVVSTAGTQTFGSIQLFFGTGDWIAYNGAVWQRVEGGSDGNFANVTLTSTDAGATASPLLELYRDSATPAASDTLGEIEFNGEDSAGNKQPYALFHASILSPTSGAEQGQLHFETVTAGALTEKMIIGTTNLVINEIGAVFNVRIEGDADANLFFTDATNSRVGVGTITPLQKLDVSSTAAGSGSAALTKADSGTANQNGQTLYFNNSHAAATGRNANVVAGNIQWQFSQPSSGALQYAGEIAVLSDAQGGASTASSLNLYSSGGLGLTVNSSANTVIAGSLSKASGSFRIDHPLLELEETHQLVHSFIEGPQADLIYRGKVNLVNGTATVNIDTASTMTEGTFVALCRDVQCFTTNESDWTAVRGSVTGNILTIEAEDNTSTASISWMVIGERKDKHMMVTDWTDDNGKVIVEPLKEQRIAALESK